MLKFIIFDLDGVLVEAKNIHFDALNEALKEMYQSKEAYLLEVVVENEENVFPMISSGSSISEILLELES